MKVKRRSGTEKIAIGELTREDKQLGKINNKD